MEKKKNTTIEEHFIYVGPKAVTSVKFKGMNRIELNKDTEFIITSEEALVQIKDDKRFKKKVKKTSLGGD